MIHPTKRCCKCRETKPVSEFNNNKDRLDGFNPRCKACNAAYYRANAERIMARQKATQAARVEYVQITEKRCPKCDKVKPIVEFHKDKRNAHGLSNHCKVCIAEYASTYYQDNHDQCIARHHKYRITHKEYYKKFYAEWFQRVRPRRMIQIRAWQQANRDRLRSYSKKARDRRYRGRGKYRPCDWRALRAFFGDKCLCCGATGALSIDHAIPLSKGGRNEIENLQPLCMDCNRRKSATIVDYRQPDLLVAFLATMGYGCIVARSHNALRNLPICSSKTTSTIDVVCE